MADRRANNDQLDLQLWISAKEGDVKRCGSLWRSGGNINMAIMGACDCPDSTTRELIQNWAWHNGACILFSIQQTHENLVEGMKYNKNISMLRGPGDVAKGTFKQE
jgi:hypothetical protein